MARLISTWKRAKNNVANPLEQFQIKTLVPIQLGSVDASLTNAGLFMVITVAAVSLFLTLGMRQRSLIPGRWQSLAEISYEFIAGMIRDNVTSISSMLRACSATSVTR